MVPTTIPAPPFDPELKAVLDTVSQFIPPTLTINDIPALRSSGFTPLLPQLLDGRNISHEEHTIEGAGGDLLVSVFRKTDQVGAGPAFLFTHVGGMVFGDRFVGITTIIDYVELFDAVIVTVEYRLAPEHPAPAALDDAYAALLWASGHSDELGFDPQKLFTVGTSAGGGIAAGITLMARDKGGPRLAGQMLLFPMLDVRNDSVSSHQVDGIGVWDRNSNEMGWTALLGDRRNDGSVAAYESAALSTSSASLPPTYLEVGSVETFRDEIVSYATSIWADAGIAELHVWPGGYHLFELIAPDAALSVRARKTRQAWVTRLLA